MEELSSPIRLLDSAVAKALTRPLLSHRYAEKLALPFLSTPC